MFVCVENLFSIVLHVFSPNVCACSALQFVVPLPPNECISFRLEMFAALKMKELLIAGFKERRKKRKKPGQISRRRGQHVQDICFKAALDHNRDSVCVLGASSVPGTHHAGCGKLAILFFPPKAQKVQLVLLGL